MKIVVCPKCHAENPASRLDCLQCGEKLIEIFFSPRTPRLRVIKIYVFPYGLLTTGKYTFSNPSVVNDQKALALA